jgi:Fe-S cluster assembly protein SufD
VTLVNNRLDPNLSTLQRVPREMVACSLADAVEGDPDHVRPTLGRVARMDDHPFAALNTAFLGDGVYVRIPRGVVVEQPLVILYLSAPGGEPTVTFPRTLIVAEEQSQVKIVEAYAALNGTAYWSCPVTEVILGEGAILRHQKIQEESPEAFHVALTQVRQSRSSSYTSHSIAIGGSLVRNDLVSLLDGQGCECVLNGLYLGSGTQHVDNHTTIDHAQRNGESRQLYKGVLGDGATAVFNGRVQVRQDAQKTNARQTNNNLLLSEEAQINTKPELEIYADDVKCAHGATIGRLEEEAIFYLRSRGIDRHAAQSILTYAFAREITDEIRVESIRTRLESSLLTRFHRGHMAKVNP